MKKILVVEDNYVNSCILEMIFKDNFIVETCDNGDTALEILLNRYDEYCCVLLDLLLPGADGITILNKLSERKITDELPVVVVSAYDSERAIINVYNCGAADILHKPVTPEIMKKRVYNIVELYESRKNMSMELLKANLELKFSKDKIAKNNEFLINALGSVVEFRSNESGNHIKRVTYLTSILITYIANKFPKYELTEDDITMIIQAAALHDVGKIAIPDSILNKPGKLTDEEFNEMKRHTLYGCDILEKFKQDDNTFYMYCYYICRWHHEKCDGKGYPDGLVGDEIPVYCQVVAIADCFDALISKRVYKDAFEPDAAFKMIINGECGKFSKDVLYTFKHCKNELMKIASSELYN